MATERIAHEDWPDTPTLEEEASTARARADSEAGRAYVIGPEDMEDYINLPGEERARLHTSRDALDAWLAARAAKYR